MEQIVKTFCVWSDLLGFSTPFAEGNWSFNNDQSRRNIARLSNVWQVAHSASSPLDEVALFLNDGIARVYDYEPELETPGDILRWLDQMMDYGFHAPMVERNPGQLQEMRTQFRFV
jgi:hypothetical protein